MQTIQKTYKIGKLRTLWIALVSCLYMLHTCGRSVIRYITGKRTNRAWVDKMLQSWAQRTLRIVKVKYKVINPHNIMPIAGVPTIIMCNHSSLYDIPLTFKAFPNNSIRMLSKKELSQIPIIGTGMKAAEFPFIDRKNKQQAIKDLKKVHHLLSSGIVLWIAPEGTRSKDGSLTPFKKGGFITAIETSATIIPIVIHGACAILPARTTQFNLNQNVEVHIGKPINAALYTTENKEILLEKVYNAMQDLMPTTTNKKNI